MLKAHRYFAVNLSNFQFIEAKMKTVTFKTNMTLEIKRELKELFRHIQQYVAQTFVLLKNRSTLR